MNIRSGQSGGTIKIFSCNSNIPLAEEVAKNLGTSLGISEVGKFSDGEISMKIDETARECDVFIIQSTSPPVNDNLMELLIMIDALRRASAGRINAVIPYFGYGRQDRKTRARDPISARLVANLIETAGADRVVTMDLHSAQIQGFFDIPVDNLGVLPIFANYYTKKFGSDMEDTVAVSPDLGSVTRARMFAQRLNIPLAIIDKRRPKANVSEVMNIIGEIEGKRVILFDDLIDTAGTIVNAAEALKDKGATQVFTCATHGILSGSAIERIKASPIDEMVFSNTVNIPEEKMIEKIKVISVSSMFANAINRINIGLSVSSLFR